MDGIKLIEIELFSKCNRRCAWCPNLRRPRDFYDELPEETFKRVIDELADMDYKGAITYSRYNEPLINTSVVKARTEYVKSKLPNTPVVFNSNGDFFTANSFVDTGADNISLMDYDNAGLEKIMDKLNMLGYKIDEIDFPRIYFTCPQTESKGMYFVDWRKHKKIVGRGNTIPKTLSVVGWENDRKIRDRPCMEPSRFVGIDYTGDVTPCCEVRSDIKKHSNMILGNVNNSSLKDIWYSDRATEIRTIMAKGDKKDFPAACKYCQKNPGRYTRDNPGIKE